MPDDFLNAAQRHTAALGSPVELTEALEWAANHTGQPYDSELPALHVRLDAGPLTAAPVAYEPWIEYRGRVLWHHLSDAHTWAAMEAHRTGRRRILKPQRVPGHGHLLWRVVPVSGTDLAHRYTVPDPDA